MTATSTSKPRVKRRPKVQIIQSVRGTPTAIAGLDMSLNRTGYCAPNGSMHSIVPDKIAEHATPWDLARRTNQIVNLLVRCMRLNPPLPELIVLEGGFFMHPGTSARLDQLRGVIRERLFSLDIQFVEISPDSLHLFAIGVTGKQADKTLMRHRATSMIRAVDPSGRVPANDDEADAWHLRRMGRVGLGLEESLAGFEMLAISGDGAKVKGCGVQW